jgi:ABC-type glutathione transport system ATPase component
MTTGTGTNGHLPDGVVLSIEDLWVEYQTSAGQMPAVRGVTLEIRSGEAVALIENDLATDNRPR